MRQQYPLRHPPISDAARRGQTAKADASRTDAAPVPPGLPRTSPPRPVEADDASRNPGSASTPRDAEGQR